jgi:hypothetical protein
LRGRQWLGLALGFAGVGLVVGQAALESATRFQGLVLAFIGVLGLVGGTLYFGRFCRGVPLLPGAAAQFLAAAGVSALAAWMLETPRADWTGGAVAAVAWNTVMVSLGGMGLYSAMLNHGSAARTTGFIAQPMARGVAEAILGYRRDPLVGPVVALGAGGVLAEIFCDVVLRMAPVTEAEAFAMIDTVKSLAPARGFRNLPKGDLAALARAIENFSHLAALPEVAEAEINPLIVLPEGQGVVMADALLSTG